MQRENIAVGIWKFSDRVSNDELVALAQEWAQDPKYSELYIRKVSKDQYGIGFVYHYLEGSSVSDDDPYKAYFGRTTDQLKRKFGNDLAGWDIASSAQFVKKG